MLPVKPMSSFTTTHPSIGSVPPFICALRESVGFVTECERDGSHSVEFVLMAVRPFGF